MVAVWVGACNAEGKTSRLGEITNNKAKKKKIDLQFIGVSTYLFFYC